MSLKRQLLYFANMYPLVAKNHIELLSEFYLDNSGVHYWYQGEMVQAEGDLGVQDISFSNFKRLLRRHVKVARRDFFSYQQPDHLLEPYERALHKKWRKDYYIDNALKCLHKKPLVTKTFPPAHVYLRYAERLKLPADVKPDWQAGYEELKAYIKCQASLSFELFSAMAKKDDGWEYFALYHGEEEETIETALKKILKETQKLAAVLL